MREATLHISQRKFTKVNGNSRGQITLSRGHRATSEKLREKSSVLSRRLKIDRESSFVHSLPTSTLSVTCMTFLELYAFQVCYCVYIVLYLIQHVAAIIQ